MSSAIELRKLARDRVLYLREISRNRRAIRFKWMNADWKLRVFVLDAVRENLSELHIDWGGANVCFRFDQAWLAQIIHSSFDLPDTNLLKDQWKMIVLESAFGEISSHIERSTRKRFVMKDLKNVVLGSDSEGFALELESDGFVSISEVWLDQLGVGFLSTALRECPVAKADLSAWGNLPIQARFMVGITHLTLSEWRALDRRDVILLDECSLRSPELDELTVEFGGNLTASGQIAGRKITIISELEKCMEDHQSDDVDQADAYDDLSVKLTFDLGARSLRLSDLLKVGPGYVFDLGRELRRAVFIRANGKIIGEGELVDIEGQIGVSVLQISPPEKTESD